MLKVEIKLKVPAVRTSVMQPRAATGGSGPVITPIASITPYQVPFAPPILVMISSLFLWKSHVETVAEQVDHQGEGDQQG